MYIYKRRYLNVKVVVMDAEILYFIAFCVEQYKMHKCISGSEAMELFDRYHVTEYLRDNYDVLHTQGHQWLLAEIDEFIQRQAA